MSCQPSLGRQAKAALIGTASPVHHLLVRRPVGGGELAFFTCYAPPGPPSPN